jgi:hypothetical protein
VEISLEDVANEFRNRYPNEFTIVMQALQITKLQELVKEQDEHINALTPSETAEKVPATRKK